MVSGIPPIDASLRGSRPQEWFVDASQDAARGGARPVSWPIGSRIDPVGYEQDCVQESKAPRLPIVQHDEYPVLLLSEIVPFASRSEIRRSVSGIGDVLSQQQWSEDGQKKEKKKSTGCLGEITADSKLPCFESSRGRWTKPRRTVFWTLRPMDASKEAPPPASIVGGPCSRHPRQSMDIERTVRSVLSRQDSGEAC